ncbi:unnamed protein product [Cunninghamella echinulata]
MILINNIKYACTSCVKGHRSTRCKHTERNLLPIRKKGRPISQCNKCREERQKYRIHQKCLYKPNVMTISSILTQVDTINFNTNHLP